MEIYEQRRELICKVVYAGPSLGGKTTNLQRLFDRTPKERRTKLTSVRCADGAEEFEAAEFKLGELGGYQVRLRAYTLPSFEACPGSYAHLLTDADGVLFVADSDARRLHHNADALAHLEATLTKQGRALAGLPLVFQWNKRDAAEATPVRRLATLLNRDDRPAVESVVTEGLGVVSAFKQLVEAVLVTATKRVAPFIDDEVAEKAARTCSSRLTAVAAPRPDTRSFPRPKTGKLARPQTQTETKPAVPEVSADEGRPHRVVGSRRSRGNRGPRAALTVLVVAAAVAAGGLLGSQEAFHGLASSIAAAVAK